MEDTEIWFNVFLMPPIPKALRFSFPFLVACEININQIKRNIEKIYLDGYIVLVAGKEEEEAMPESSSDGNMEESQTCLYLFQ